VGVAGFLYPGSHVDVLVTFKVENSPAPITQTILPNVEVLTAGQKIEPDPKGKPETVSVVTLLLKPEDGEKLVLASTQGVIQFVLRNGADQNSPDTKAVDMADLMTGAKKPVVEKRVVVKAAPRVVKQAVFHEVETISGEKKSVDKFE
jgi:pilus assembly protein CpaB